MHTMFARYWVLRAPEVDLGGGSGGGGGAATPPAGGEGDNPPPGDTQNPPPGDNAPPPGGGDDKNPPPGDKGGKQPSADELKEAADKLSKEYNLDEPSAGEGDNPPPNDKGGEAYELAFPDGFSASPEFTALATPIAKELGLDGKQAGAYAAGVIQAIQQEEQANFRKTDAELKQKWGRDYGANKAEAQRFYNWCLEGGDFSKEDLRVFHSPKGVELLFKMSQRLGEKSTAQKPAAGKQSELEWAEAAYNDPKHPDYRALRDVDDPRFEQVRERYNRAKGYKM